MMVVRWSDIANATSYNLRQADFKNTEPIALTATAPSGNPGLTLALPFQALLFYRVAGTGPCGEGPL